MIKSKPARAASSVSRSLSEESMLVNVGKEIVVHALDATKLNSNS